MRASREFWRFLAVLVFGLALGVGPYGPAHRARGENPRPAQTALRPGARPGGWATPKSRVPDLDPMARGVVSHQEVFASPGAAAVWYEPAALSDGLDLLADEPAARRWTADTAELVARLGTAVSTDPAQADPTIQALEASVAQAQRLAASLPDVELASRLRRAAYALTRRLAVWRQIAQDAAAAVPGNRLPEDDAPPADPQQLALCLAEIEALTHGSAEGRAWRDYLLMDSLRQWADRPAASPKRLPPNLARQVLQRLAETPMSVAQRRFASDGPLLALRAELRRWAAEPVDAAEVLGHLEQYEQSHSVSDAGRLAKDCAYLQFSPRDTHRRLAERLQTHYRNANLRVAITGELLTRLMPERDPEYAPVCDTVLGVPVYGQSTTSTQVRMRLLPHPSRVRMALEITGEVASLTSSSSGPATFYNDSQSTYTARKPFEVDLRGIHLWPAEVDVDNDTRLRRLKTDFDGVPLVGLLVKQMARSQHQQKQPEARREIEEKVARKAKQRVDTEADARLGKASQRLRHQILDRLDALSLDPEVIDAETTERRLTLRLRLAGEDQLGSHTPRPRAPADSLASLQVHQSAINNALQRLQLEGRTFTAPQLADHVAARVGTALQWDADPTLEDVSIRFAEQDAVAVHLQDGQVALTLAIARLSKPPRTWKDFRVRAFYRPDCDDRSIVLFREEVIHLLGTRLGTSSQIALRGIFARTFSKHRPIDLTPERLLANPKLDDLGITQLTIEDGWLGAALGPRRRPVEPVALR